MIILLFGPPGSGKGTQAAFIARRFHIPAISTGELFRAECKANTPLGRAACSILKSGGLVSDDIVNQMVAGRIAQPDCAAGFLLDGYPRTSDQAQFLEKLLDQRGLPAPIPIHLDVAAEELVSRITARRQCERCGRIYNLRSQPPRIAGICDADGAVLIGREDDTESVILERLKAYEEATGPVVEHYANSGAIHLNGSAAPEQISAQIEQLLPCYAAA